MNDFPLSKDSYVAFDGLSIKEKIRQRLNASNIFTDQNFEGSNLAAFTDAFAMGLSMLLFNLSKGATEGSFSFAQIYENMNRIVKDIDYKPIGHQTSILSYTMSATTIDAGIYTIPRYTSISVGGIPYSFSDDFSFTKLENSTTEEIDLNDKGILHQGYFIEFPLFTASGTDNELIYITGSDSDIIDNFNIHVYIKSTENKWQKWSKTNSLYLHNSNDRVFEIRFNENKRYELKFGNNINGRRLNEGDLVAIYYLKSNGSSGEVGANVLRGKVATVYGTPQFNQIIGDLETYSNYMTRSNIQYLLFDNSCTSSNYSEPESVSEIRANAPGTFRSQYRLVTKNDYETFIKTNFSNIIHDVIVMNNTEYLDSYIKYFYNIGLTQPQLESRAMFNQMKFADSCNFNNVYAFCVPKTISKRLGYLAPSQKAFVKDTLDEEKTLTSEFVLMDPVYLAVDFALNPSGDTTIDDIQYTELLIEKNYTSRRNDFSIITDVNAVINDYFNRSNYSLGQDIDSNVLLSNILGIEGIKKVHTIRTDTGYSVEGLRMIIWNPIYPDLTTESIVGIKTIDDFQFPYFFDNNFKIRIVVQESSRHSGANY